MSWTAGQRLALSQLEEIANNSQGAIVFEALPDAASKTDAQRVQLSVLCRGLPRVDSGLALRDRERLFIDIPSDFPYRTPSVSVAHSRFAGAPHVQWCRHLCLYVSTETEWNPSEGMFGLVQRLWDWLSQGSMDQLDPEGAPLHPPVAYATADGDLVIPRADTPTIADEPWVGLAVIHPRRERRVDIVGWTDLLTPPTEGQTGVACLLASPFPFEYPGKIAELLDQLRRADVDIDRLLLCLEWAAMHNPDGTPLYVVIGTPMRGLRGASVLSQHLSVWRLNPVVADSLRLTSRRLSDRPEIREIAEKLRTALLEWADAADVSWCTVRELRPEVTVPRDRGTPMEAFLGKAVAIWGTGALGGHVAEMLVRGGARQLVLRDNGIVTPGVLSRQPFDDLDIGRRKVEALAERLTRIAPGFDVRLSTANVLDSPLGANDWTGGADVVFDTTASIQVLAKSELTRAAQRGVSAPVVSMVIDQKARRGMLAVVGARFSGGVFDAIRKGKLEVCRRAALKVFADAFWPEIPPSAFQPEPGCSSSTFVGSAADIQSLASLMLNGAAGALTTLPTDQALVQFFEPDVPSHRTAVFSFAQDIVSVDPESGYEIRISPFAWKEIIAWIRRSRRTLGRRVETGGLLFGQLDTSARIIWVSEVLGPPPDSISSPDGFVTGTRGVAEANREKRQRSRGSVSFLGMWHTHPDGTPLPSATDLNGMAQIVAATDSNTQRALLLIVGGDAPAAPSLGCFLFDRRDFGNNKDRVLSRECAIRLDIPAASKGRRIGLALSGGGARAMAFHLGCMRALHDRGILDQVSVLSTVSGGSIIGAMYAYSSDEFEAFDERVQRILRTGLTGAIVGRSLHPSRLGRSALTAVTAGVAATGSALLRLAVEGASMLGVRLSSVPQQAPFRRRHSRTDSFAAALDGKLFRQAQVSRPRRVDLDIVINATEMRTGTAFRFSNRGCGGSRFGQLSELDPPVALAVAASAAYPALLPALDRTFTFVRKDGTTSQSRVVLSDGGIYDNLGSLCMEPGRTGSVSEHVYSPDYLIVCDAGVGTVPGTEVPYWWPKRMSIALDTMFRRVQNSTRDRLYRYVESGALAGFAHCYLGLDDDRLPWRPADLVPRSAVVGYPTDLSPMSGRNLALLADRGEQLTRLLVAHYPPEL